MALYDEHSSMRFAQVEKTYGSVQFYRWNLYYNAWDFMHGNGMEPNMIFRPYEPERYPTSSPVRGPVLQ